MRFTCTAFLLVLLTLTTNAAITTKYSNPCSINCKYPEDSLFKPGQTYIYSYEGESNIDTVTGQYDSTGLKIKSKIKITALSGCYMKLSMSEVQVFDKTTKYGNDFQQSPNDVKIKKILEQKEVFFTKNNGKVESICMDKDEPQWSENMKKVIIDKLANLGLQTEENKYQKTSHGKCLVQKENMEKSFLKTKVGIKYDLKTCESNRYSQSIFTDLTKASLFDKSEVTCEYLYGDISDLKSVQCKEEYKIVPFKQNGNRIVVEIKTLLIKESEMKETHMSFDNKNLFKTGIEQSHDEFTSEESTFTSVKETLKSLCDEKKNSQSSKIPNLFMKLISQMKELDSKEFKEIYLDVLKDDICSDKQSEIRSIFNDAVGFVNTPAATSVMIELIKSNQLSAFDQNVWLTSLSFMKQIPTIEMLKELESLISTEKPNIPTYLGISAVTNLFCKENHKLCSTDLTIKSIIKKFLENLNKDCSLKNNEDKGQLSKIQISLKALGNLKLFPTEVTDVLRKCVSTKTNEMSVRVSALEVMRHMDCGKDRQYALTILEDDTNDSELRINAYLTMMGCPDINTLFKVREILAKEKVNQVGSFIWTHLTNIKESSDVLKSHIRELLEDVKFKKEFDINKLKFSRNIEKTFKRDRFGMTFDSNIIFSEKSFIPRSISVNTTAIVMDKPTSFVELSARLEKLEDLLYKLFGPDGYAKKETNAKDNLALIDMLNELSGNINIKLYGQQISFIELLRGSLGSIKKYNIIEELLSLVQAKNFEINKNLLLVDKSVALPTMLGFPLQLKLQGSVYMNIKIKTKFGVTGLFNWPADFNIDTHISPNIDAEFNADIILQAPFSNYGMKLNLKSTTDTEMKAEIYSNNKEGFSFKVDTIKKKQSIISLEGNGYVIHRGSEIKQLEDKIKREKICTGELFNRILGQKFCGEIGFIDPAFKKNTLLFEPFSAELYIEKTDKQTHYILRASSKSVLHVSDNGKTHVNRFIKFEFDTPNSEVYNRRFLGEFALDFKENYGKFGFRTPWNQFSISSSFKLTNDEKKIGFKVHVNDKEIADIMADNVRLVSDKEISMKGGIHFSLLKISNFKTNWNFVFTNHQWLLDFSCKGLMKDDAQVKLKILKIQSARELSIMNKYKISGNYKSYFGTGSIDGFASETYYGYRWDVKINHKPKDKNSDQFTVIFRHKTEDKSSVNLKKYQSTTTFGYGKKAENFVKFIAENELSNKHIRTSLKTSYGQYEKGNPKVSEEIKLELYGGHTWKEDNKHYAEGSFSLVYPTKNLNYEGRYNSEIGKKIFKMSLALDKDQQSKLNLKINYLKPKLYLEDTDFDVVFSLPNCNIDIKWKLMETDVNKYWYSLVGKYNSYDMQISGVETQISKYNHESSVTIKLPRIQSLPKEVKINAKVNFEDLSQALIYGKVEIPSTKTEYSINTKLSYIPLNFLQISTSPKSHVFNLDMKLSTTDKAVRSKVIFTCNPEEFQSYFMVNWNGEINEDDQIELNIYALQKNPNYKLFKNAAQILIRYPGNEHSVGFKSEFKYTEMIANINVIWNKNRRISINSMYELDNSWTQKGLTASLTIKTPFVHFEQIHFGINAVGQLRYRKVNFECKWGSKKILFDIVLQPKSANDFSLNWKLVTPWKGMNLIHFFAKHMTTTNSINSEYSLEIGPTQRYLIKLDAINNSDRKNRDYLGNIVIESGSHPSIKVSVQHKDNSVQYQSQLDVAWMKTESLNIKSDISYKREMYELATKGNIEFYSTIKELKQMKAAWSIENQDANFVNDIQLSFNRKDIFQSSLKGFYEQEQEAFKIEFSGVATVMNVKSIKIANNFLYQYYSSIQHRFSISQDTTSLYSHNLNFIKGKGSLKILIPNSKFKTIEYHQNYGKISNGDKSQMSLKIGEKYLFKLDRESNVKIKSPHEKDGIFVHKLYSDYTSTKQTESRLKISSFKNGCTIESEVIIDSKKATHSFIEMIHSEDKQKLKVTVKSIYEPLKSFHFLVENERKIIDDVREWKLELNVNDVFKSDNKVSFRGSRNVNIDFMLRHRSIFRFLKLKYDHHLMGYDHLLETNIFGRRMKYTLSSQSRGGVAIYFNIHSEMYFLKSLEIFGRFSKEIEITVTYQLQKQKENEKHKLSYSVSRGIYKLDVNSPYILSKVKLDLNELKRMLVEIKTTPKFADSKVQLQFDYEGGVNNWKHSNQLKLNIGNVYFELDNKLEKVKWKYLLIGSQINTNYYDNLNYKVELEYRLKPSQFNSNFKARYFKRFITVSTNFDFSSESKMDLKVETSFPIIKEIVYKFNQKHNDLYSQVSHKCKISVKSYERVLNMENVIEWTGINYVNIDWSIYGEMSPNNYLIQPKSFKYFHQFYKNIFKQDVKAIFSKDVNFKAHLQIPFDSQSQSSFDFESTYEKLKKLSVDFNINLLEKKQKSLSLKVLKNTEAILLWESKYLNQDKLFSFVTNVDIFEAYKTGLEIELSETTFGQKIFKAKFDQSLLKEPIALTTKVDLQKGEMSTIITGALKGQMSILGQITSNKYSVNMKYLDNVINFQLLFNENERTTSWKLFSNSLIKLNVNFHRSADSIKFKGQIEDHFLKFHYDHKKALNVDFNFFNKKLNVEMNRKDFEKFTVKGNSNFKDWKQFAFNSEIRSSSSNVNLKTSFLKNYKEIIKILSEIKFRESFTVQYTSEFEMIKDGKMELNYKDLPSKVSLKFDGELFGKRSIDAAYTLNKDSFSIKIVSSFDWIRSVTVEGKLQLKQFEKKGSFSMNHNKISMPITGEFIEETKPNQYKLQVKSSLSYPYNELNFKIQRDSNLITVETSDSENKWLVYKAKTSSPYQIDINIKIPKSIKELTFEINSVLDYESTTKLFKLKTKSNLFKEMSLELTCNIENHKYTANILTPSKESQLQLQISNFEESGRQISLSSKYGDDKHSAEFFYKVSSSKDLYLKAVLKSSTFFNPSATFEAEYKHKIVLPNSFNIDIQSKFNDQTIFFKSISWTRHVDKSFDLMGKLILSPYEKEYESKINIIYKQSEKLDVVISSPEILKGEIKLKMSAIGEKVDISFDSPFEIIKSIKLSRRSVKSVKSWKDIITFTANKLGKYEIINEYVIVSNTEVQVSSQINTPLTERKVYVQGNLRNTVKDQSLTGKFELDGQIYQIALERQDQQIRVQVNTPWKYLKALDMVVREKQDTYESEIFYNEFQVNVAALRNDKTVSVKIQSNTEYFKIFSVSVETSERVNEKGKSIIVKIKRDAEYSQMKYEMNGQKNIYTFSLDNNLIEFLPSKVSGKVQYSSTSMDIFVDLKVNDISFFKFIVNENEFLFHSQLRMTIYKPSAQEIKVYVTRKSVEFILLTDNVFSVLITRTTDSQIDGAVIINGNKYSLKASLQTDIDGKWIFKISSFKNALEKMLEINCLVEKPNKLIDFHVTYLAKTILKLKLSNKDSPKNSVSMEIALLLFNGVMDFTWEKKTNMIDSLLSWNFLYDEKQIHLGSIEYGIKSSTPINYLLSISLQSTVFQAQFSEKENGEFQVKLLSPFQKLNTIIKYHHYSNNPGLQEIRFSIDNGLIGQYSVKSSVLFNNDLEVKFVLASVVKLNLKVITSVANQYSINTELILFDWEKIEFSGKLSTKDLIELIAELKTPFKALKQVRVEKTFSYISISENNYETKIIYQGLKKIQFSTGHEIRLQKKMLKIKSSLYSDEMRMVSLDVDHSGSHDLLDHSFIVYIKEDKYGFKLNGGFKPLFEGKTEIFTPFHEAGKVVLMGKQMKNGMIFEAGKNDEQLGAFEFKSEKEVKMMKLTPPSQYGKSVSIKYKNKRVKRSAENEIETEIRHGTDELVNLFMKIKMDKDKYNTFVKVSAPKITKKTASLSLSHNNNDVDNSWNFDHKLQIDDTLSEVYRLFGHFNGKSVKDFNVSLNAEHPTIDPLHLSFGHSASPNRYNNHFLLKSKDETMMKHNGDVVFDFERPHFAGQWETIMKSNHHKVKASHSGDWKDFVHTLIMERNNEPYLNYKGQFKPREHSDILIELPTSKVTKIRIFIDNINKKIELLMRIKDMDHVVEICHKDGYVQMKYRKNLDNVSSMTIGYATEPLYIKGNYLQHFATTEMTVSNSLISLMIQSSFPIMKKGLLKVSHDKMMLEFDSAGKIYTMAAKYKISPDNSYMTIETSLKQLSKVHLQITPGEWKLSFNEYFQTLKYVIKQNRFHLTGTNNFMLLKSFLLDLNLETPKKVLIKMELNSLTGQAKVEYSENQLLMTVENNYLVLRSVEFELFRNIQSTVKYHKMVLSINKVQNLKVQMEWKNRQSSLGIETWLGHHFVVSFNEPVKELIISYKHHQQYFNAIFKMSQTFADNSKTLSFEASIDSSASWLQKLKNQVSYKITSSGYYFQSISQYNSQFININGELTKSKILIKFNKDETIYQLTGIKHLPNKFSLETISPGRKLDIVVSNEDGQFSGDIEFNKAKILNVVIKNKKDHKNQFEHKSMIHYYEGKVWDLSLSTDLKRHTLDVTVPFRMYLNLISDLKENENSKFSFLLRHYVGNEPKEIGAGISFLLKSQSSFIDVHMENSFHILRFTKTVSLPKSRQISFELNNKKSLHQWILSINSVKAEKFELFWKTPTTKREIKYNQIIENNVRTYIDLDIFGNFKFNLKKSAVSNPSKWEGFVSVYNSKLASIEAGDGYINAVINEGESKNKRIVLKWVSKSQGTWKKDFVSTKQLIIIQKELNINVDLTQTTKMESSLYSSIIAGKYQFIDGKSKSLKFGGTIDFSKLNAISIDLDSPLFSININLRRSQPDKGTLRYEMVSILNKKDKMSGYFQLSLGSYPGLELKLHYNPKDHSNFLQMHSKYIDHRQMETHIFIEQNQIRTTYFQFLIRLLNEHHIETTFAKRHTRFYFDIINILLSPISANRILENLLIEHSLIKQEVTERYEQILSIIPDGSKLQIEFTTLLIYTRLELDQLFSEIDAMFKRDEFYMRSIADITERVVSFFNRVTFKALDFLISKIPLFLDNIIQNAKMVIKCIFRLHSTICRKIYSIMNTIFNPIENIVQKIFVNILSTLQKIISSGTRNLKFCFDQIVKASICFYKNLQNFFFILDAIIHNEFVENSINIIKVTIEKIMTDSFDILKSEKEFQNIYKYYIKALETLSSKLIEHLESFLKSADFSQGLYKDGNEYFSKSREMLSAVCGYFIQQMKDENNQKILTDFVQSSVTNSFTDIKQALTQSSMNIIWPKFIYIDPRKDQRLNNDDESKIIIRYTSPIPINDFLSLPDFNYVTRKINKVKAAIHYLRQSIKNRLSSGSKLIELKNWFTLSFPSISYNSVLPEFESYATISKGSVTTFDKQLFQLTGDVCRVVLSKDIQFKKWEIILNQQNHERYYTINIGSNSIEISGKDYKVSLNGKPAELPIKFGSTSLTGLGRLMKLKDDSLGLTVMIDPINEMFTVGISGWYHGKVRGLFGNSDNEPFNDFMLEDGKIVTSDKFMKTFNDKGKSCGIEEKREKEITTIKESTFLRKMVCKFLFKCPFSSLGNCFKTVDPSNFYAKCMNSKEELSGKLDPSICNSARQYQTQCNEAGIKISVPYPCQKCDMMNENSVPVNEFRVVKINEIASDIVFIVDEGENLNALKPKLINLVSVLENEMKSKRIQSVKFGLITFVGNQDERANFHTLGQKMLGSQEEIIKSLQSLKSSNGGFRDYAGAIVQAYNYPFRSHASKHIIMISSRSINELPITLQSLSDKLEKKFIHFSLLTDFTFKLKQVDKNSIIFGVDSKNIYTPLSINGNGNLTTRPENDFLYKLAMKVKGVVYDYKFMVSSQELTSKRFTTSFANQISQRASPARSTKCTCVADGEYDCSPLELHNIFPVNKVA